VSATGNPIVIRDAANPSIEVYYAHLSHREVIVGKIVPAGADGDR
jgi:hypothetical protein